MTEVGRLFQMAGKARPPYAGTFWCVVPGVAGRVDERNVTVIDEPEC